jgi:hypothetical protein
MKVTKLPVYTFAMLAVVVLAFFSCKEENPGIIFTKPTVIFSDTTYIAASTETPQPKNALVEDFTGVRCTNCPTGHRAIDQMQAENPHRIIALAMHGRDFPNFTSPIDSINDIDMREDFAGIILNSIVGRPLGLPFGTIDRVYKSSTAGAWGGYATTRIGLTTKVNLSVKTLDYDPSTRELNVTVKAVFLDSLAESPLFTIGIYENGLIAPQKDQDLANDPIKHGVEPLYVHNHVLRDMPAFSQKLMPDSLGIDFPEKNRVVEKSFSIKLKEGKNGWAPENCYLVFYVHRSLEVLQVIEKKIL